MKYARREFVLENVIPEDERVAGKLDEISARRGLQLFDQVNEFYVVVHRSLDATDYQGRLNVRTERNKVSINTTDYQLISDIHCR